MYQYSSLRVFSGIFIGNKFRWSSSLSRVLKLASIKRFAPLDAILVHPSALLQYRPVSCSWDKMRKINYYLPERGTPRKLQMNTWGRVPDYSPDASVMSPGPTIFRQKWTSDPPELLFSLQLARVERGFSPPHELLHGFSVDWKTLCHHGLLTRYYYITCMRFKVLPFATHD